MIIYGTRLFGTLDACGGSYIGTKFFHIYWMPIIPLGSTYVHEKTDQGYRGLPLGLNLRSTLAAYLRTWGTLAAIGSVLAVLSRPEPAMLVVTVPAVVLAGWAWFSLGRLGPDERAKVSVYAEFLGHYSDPARMGEVREALHEPLAAAVAKVRPGVVANDAAGRPVVKYDTFSSDASYLRPALTLSRLEWSLASGPAKEELAATHELLWKRLREVDADVLAPAIG
jgi:hypothetical protein